MLHLLRKIGLVKRVKLLFWWFNQKSSSLKQLVPYQAGHEIPKLFKHKIINHLNKIVDLGLGHVAICTHFMTL